MQISLRPTNVQKFTSTVWQMLELWQLVVFLIIVVSFHVLEYVVNKRNHPDDVSVGSTLITIPFLFAGSFGIAEFLIESYLFGDMKTTPTSPVMWFGLVMSLSGLAVRVLAELTAGKSFTHHIAYDRVEPHKLITHGVYSAIRHPGYFGMFVFSVGTQIFLRNPVSTVVFSAVLWKFFSDRIQDEEKALVSMFGRDYVVYREKTRTWIPFID